MNGYQGTDDGFRLRGFSILPGLHQSEARDTKKDSNFNERGRPPGGEDVLAAGPCQQARPQANFKVYKAGSPKLPGYRGIMPPSINPPADDPAPPILPAITVR
jgi:hypothetical protein